MSATRSTTPPLDPRTLAPTAQKAASKPMHAGTPSQRGSVMQTNARPLCRTSWQKSLPSACVNEVDLDVVSRRCGSWVRPLATQRVCSIAHQSRLCCVGCHGGPLLAQADLSPGDGMPRGVLHYRTWDALSKKSCLARGAQTHLEVAGTMPQL